MAHVDPDHLILLALGEPSPDPADAAHLADCRTCRDELDATRHVADLARDGEELRDLPAPPPALWDRIAAEALGPAGPGVRRATGLATAPQGVVLPFDQNRRRQVRRRSVLVAAVALLVGVIGTVGVVRLASGDSDGGRVVARAALLPPAGAPGGAHGSAQVIDTGHGLQVKVDVEGMPVIAGYYTVWIYDGKDVMIPLGSPGAAPLNLPPAAGDLAVFHVVDVSAQDLGQQQHGRSLLQGTLQR